MIKNSSNDNIIILILKNKMIQFIVVNLILWRLFIELISRIGSMLILERSAFTGPVPWANFDGAHYLSIADIGYVQFEQAFFPVFPLLIRLIGEAMDDRFIVAGTLIVHLSLFGMLVFLWKLVPFIPKIPKEKILNVQRWTILFTLYFPTSFFFGSIYTESLFLFLVTGSFYALINKRYSYYVLGAALASGVRLVGAFLMIPAGLILYMYYLFRQTGDPLLFMHVQPAFGANRSGDELVILPQVFWRYLNIFIKVPIVNYDWWLAVFEFLMFNIALILLWLAWRSKFPKLWIYFSLAVIILPTLTGTLSSIPRYVLAAFPLYFILAMLPSRLRYAAFAVCIVLSVILTILFTRGYWVS